VKPNQTIKVLDREGNLVETGPRHKDPGLPGPGAPADRARRGGRHRLDRGPGEGLGRRHLSARPR
jgi:hypothetical protein